MNIRFEIDADPEPIYQWRCHSCGAAGDGAAGMAEAEYLAESVVEGTPTVTYLRPHCGVCLPAPGGRMDLGAPAWQSHHRAGGRLVADLRRAVDEGAVDAQPAGAMRCLMCGKQTAEHLTSRIVYAAAADRDETVCLDCLDEPGKVVEEACRRREQGLSPATVA